MTISGHLGLTNLLIAVLPGFLGLALLRKVRVTLPAARPILRKADSLAGSYLLGIPFGLSVCPACTPLGLPNLGATAATGTPWVAAALLLVFGPGRGVTVVVAGRLLSLGRHTMRGIAGELKIFTLPPEKD